MSAPNARTISLSCPPVARGTITHSHVRHEPDFCETPNLKTDGFFRMAYDILIPFCFGFLSLPFLLPFFLFSFHYTLFPYTSSFTTLLSALLHLSSLFPSRPLPSLPIPSSAIPSPPFSSFPSSSSIFFLFFLLSSLALSGFYLLIRFRGKSHSLFCYFLFSYFFFTFHFLHCYLYI